MGAMHAAWLTGHSLDACMQLKRWEGKARALQGDKEALTGV